MKTKPITTTDLVHHLPLLSPRAAAEREALRREIENDMTKLETLRQREAVLRAVLVGHPEGARL